MKTCTNSLRNKLPVLAATAMGMALATAANAQVLYTNGSFKTGTTSQSGVVAPAGFEWSEVMNDAGNTTQSNTVAGFGDNYNSAGQQRLADNFTVPAGQTWSVSSVCMYTYTTGGAISPALWDLAVLQIWNGRPGDVGSAVIFGDTTTNRLTAATDHMTFRVFNTLVPAPGTVPGTTRRVWQIDLSALTAGNPLVLPAGQYWADWSSSNSLNTAHFGPARSVLGVRSLPGWNARQFIGSTSGGAWGDCIDAGNPSPTTPDLMMDLPFVVKGAQGNNCLSPLPPCAADVFPVGGDGVVNIDDLVQGVINHFGQVGPPRPIGDCFPLPNGDCLVNIDDLIQGVINNWGNCPVVNVACCINNVCSQIPAATCAASNGLNLGVTPCVPNICPIAPANDNCASRIPANDGANAWNNTNANTDGAVPPCGTPASRDVWFNYTATCTGHVTFNTIGTVSPFTDTVIVVYSGNGCAPLGAVLGCNDDLSTSSLLSSLTIDLTQGQIVKVRCMSFGTAAANQGAAVLNITCALANNDICADAQSVTIGVAANSNIQGATQDQAPLCNGVSTGIGRWFKVTGNGKNLRASTCESAPFESWDGRLSVYCGNTATPCTAQTCVNASGTFDCGPGGATQTGLHERVDWCSANGQVYYVLVHTDALPLPPEGAFQLLVSDLGTTCTTALQCGPVPPPSNDECVGAVGAFAGTCPVTFTVTSAMYVTYTSNSADPITTCEIANGGPFTHDAGWWYSLTTAAGQTTMKVSMCAGTSSLFDPVCGLYSACGGSQVACDDDFCHNPAFSPSEFCATVAANTTYKLFVNHYATAQPGTYTTAVTCPCNLPVCGNGILEPGEQCDDGNVINGDGCSSTCQIEIGAPACGLVCTLTEPEPCSTVVDATNAGCNSTPTAFTAVTHNTTVCGNGWATPVANPAGNRDTDWYTLTVGASGRVEVHIKRTGTSGLNFVTFILTGVCPPALLGTAADTSSGLCTVAQATGLVPMSTARVFVGAGTTAAGIFTGFPCPGGTYEVTIKSP